MMMRMMMLMMMMRTTANEKPNFVWSLWNRVTRWTQNRSCQKEDSANVSLTFEVRICTEEVCRLLVLSDLCVLHCRWYPVGWIMRMFNVDYVCLFILRMSDVRPLEWDNQWMPAGLPEASNCVISIYQSFVQKITVLNVHVELFCDVDVVVMFYIICHRSPKLFRCSTMWCIDESCFKDTMASTVIQQSNANRLS
jgi:hypothetical protein